jgi:hypothetical protein
VETFHPGQRIIIGNGTVHVVVKMADRIGNEPARVEVEGGLQWLADDCEPAPEPQGPAAELALGQRVRTLINLDSTDWAPEQPDIPAGALGTIEGIHRDPFTGRIWKYGVLLDASVDRLAAAMDPTEIEPVTNTTAPTPDLADRLAATAAGTWGEEAAVWLLTQHRHWLDALDRAGLIRTDPEYPGWAEINWSLAASAVLTRGDGSMVGTPSEWQVLAVACSLTGRHALGWSDLASLDEHNRRLVLHAIAWAAGGRDWAGSLGL